MQRSRGIGAEALLPVLCILCGGYCAHSFTSHGHVPHALIDPGTSELEIWTDCAAYGGVQYSTVLYKKGKIRSSTVQYCTMYCMSRAVGCTCGAPNQRAIRSAKRAHGAWLWAAYRSASF